MTLSPAQIEDFFNRIKDQNLPICFLYEDTKGDQKEFEKLVRMYFGNSYADLILEDSAIDEVPLRINGTNWEQLIAKWRMSLS